jgi:hypothetical protein
MIRLGDIRKDLENYDYCEVIFNLSEQGCEREKLGCKWVYELLQRDDDYMIPYNCYEVVYDWDDLGCGDGTDSVCFYSDKVGFLAKNEDYFKTYGKPWED